MSKSLSVEFDFFLLHFLTDFLEYEKAYSFLAFLYTLYILQQYSFLLVPTHY